MKPRQQTLHRARGLRAGMTRPEVALWQALRRDALGVRFRRQHPLGPYILDFYCEAHRLAVEVDGAGHGMGDNPGHDERRDAWLRGQGIEVLRISARAVLADVSGVMSMIRAALGLPPKSPPATVGEVSPQATKGAAPAKGISR